MRDYIKQRDLLAKIQNKNQTVFLCALTQLLTDGIDCCADYNIAEISAEINNDSKLSKEFQLEIFQRAKEIARNVSPFNLLTFIKEEMQISSHTKITAERYKKIAISAIEHMYYPDDGGDHRNKKEIMNIFNLDEDEWKEIMGGE